MLGKSVIWIKKKSWMSSLILNLHSRWCNYLKVKIEIIKMLEENIGNFCNESWRSFKVWKKPPEIIK